MKNCERLASIALAGMHILSCYLEFLNVSFHVYLKPERSRT